MASGTPASGTMPETQVRVMFDRIAGVYDRMNSVMTAGMHHRWRERAADLARVGPGARALDVATGTGDLAVELAGRGASVTGLDFSEGMLELARRKAPQLEWVQGNALDLAYADAEFDAVTVGFGARNFSDLDQGIREMARVVKPGGRVVILEITTPRAAAAVVVLLALVRPSGARRGPRGRLRGLHLPALERSPLSKSTRSWGRGWRRRDWTRCAGS